MLYIVFMGIFWGWRVFGILPLGPGLQAIIVGYLMWFLASFTIDHMSSALQDEAGTGTLEQVVIGPFSLSAIMAVRLFVGTLFQLIIIGIIGLLIMVTTGQFVYPAIAFLFPIGITILGLWGFGFGLGGLALVFKRIGQIPFLLQLGLLGAVFLPLDQLPRAVLVWIEIIVPLLKGVHIIEGMIAGITPSLLDYGILLSNTAIHLITGSLIFRQALSITRDQGLMAHY
ncbi:hypothetical protein M1O16_03435 [Dehalococcoidia bacterium]|nr:hypothetical protein [Dehalococcoidia bacterium]